MLQSHFVTHTQKHGPKDEVARNADLLVRAGFVDKLHAGVYTFLPLGLRVLKRIEEVIRRRMNHEGGQELLMPTLQPKELWQTTGRWDTMDDLFKLTDTSEKEYALGPTHEEVVVPLMSHFISSYRHLPRSVYQFQNKFRMELRAKSGILRVREFIMKDMYSFHANEEDLMNYYERMKIAYADIFREVGLAEYTYLTFASGGSFSKYSHEFQTVTEAGEDTIYICDTCRVAVNKEIKNDQPTCPECGKTQFREERAVEIGNIFNLKTKFSEPFGLTYTDAGGIDRLVLMGCYGIGLGRVMGTVAEVLSDARGLSWPGAIAPFDAHVLAIGGSDDVRKEAERVAAHLELHGKETLFDDRDVGAGEKFVDADLIGIPVRIVVSEKTLSEGKLEVKWRATGKVLHLSPEEILTLW